MRFFNKSIATLTALASGLLHSTAAHAGPLSFLQSLEVFQEDTGLPFQDFEPLEPGPYVQWAKPLDSGPIRCVAIAPQYAMTDLRLLAAVLDMEPQAIPMWRADALDNPNADSDAAPLYNLLQQALEDSYPVYLMGNTDLGAIPSELFQQIADKVTAGAGLVMTHTSGENTPQVSKFLDKLAPLEQAPLFKDGIGAKGVPGWEQGPYFVEAGTVGEGRVAIFRYPGQRPLMQSFLPAFTEPDRTSQEHVSMHLSLLARAIRWAANREPSSRISRIEFAGVEPMDEDSIPPDLPEAFIQTLDDAQMRHPFPRYRIHFSEPLDRRLDLAVYVRSPDGSREAEYEAQRLEKGAESALASLYLNSGPGDYFLDVKLLNRRGRVVDWHTKHITVEGWPDLEPAELEKPAVRDNDVLQIATEVRPTLHQPRSSIVYARAVDGNRVLDGSTRVVAEAWQQVSPEGGRVMLGLDLVDLVGPHIRIELLALAQRLDHRPAMLERLRGAYESFSVPVHRPADHDGLELIMEGPPPNTTTLRHLYQNLGEMGADTVYLTEGITAAMDSAYSPLEFIPRLLPNPPEHLDHEDVRDFEATTDIQRQASAAWNRGASKFTLALNPAGPSQSAAAESAALLSAFHDFLRARYGSLDSLNAAWNADHAAWPEIEPWPAGKAMVDQNFTPWFDWARFQDEMGADALSDAVQQVRSLLPDTRTGMALDPESASLFALDWASIAKEAGLLAIPPDPLLVDKLRWYAQPRQFRALYCGGGSAPDSEAHARWLPWHALFHGMQGVWMLDNFATARRSPDYPVLQPSGRPTRYFETLARTTAELDQGGVDRLLKHAEPMPPEIAILDSRESYWANTLDPSFYANTLSAQGAWAALLQDLNYAYRFVPAWELPADGLDHVNLLILPMARALSDETVRAIEAFLDQGGNLIADVPPAQFDENGAPREQPPLDGPFGIARNGPVQPSDPLPVTVQPPERGDNPKNDRAPAGEFEGVVCDSNVRAKEAVAWGQADGIPAWLLFEQDRGGRLFLNHPMPSYEQGADSNEGAALRECMAAALAEIGIKPSIQLEHGSSGTVPASVYTLQYGDAQLVGILCRPEGDNSTVDGKLRFEDEHFVHNVLEGERERRQDEVRFKLPPGGAALYARLPYETGALEVAAPKEVPAGNRVNLSIRVLAREKLPGRHLLQISMAPMGIKTPLSHYTHYAETGETVAKTYIPLAKNETPGWYTITIRDVLTGVDYTHEFKVLPPNTP